ncbi:MAG TPA: erythromycin esterase family protein [Candidatus Elarobacter sp.]|nr:erythromycin esterase family protein [Candidatus Elarobacter sp.]
MTGAHDDHDAIIDAARAASMVLIGEASHGTTEFYAERARITRRLIVELGFHAVAVEGDWPDAYRVNRYVRCRSDDMTADASLEGFRWFPTWMWRNLIVEEFVEWLRARNMSQPLERQASFYGLDMYSLYASVEAVLLYLDRTDPDEARNARERYSCFEYFGADAQAYGYAATHAPSASCERAVVEQLQEMQRKASQYEQRDGQLAVDDFFFAEQNARLVKNAEEYYRSMFRGGASSWNLRDQHMCETLYAIANHLRVQGMENPRIVVWAHNSHLGDARATQMETWGEWNLGQLVRERSGPRALNVGFTTYTGGVTAAGEWDEPPQHMHVVPGMPGSYERLFHQLDGADDAAFLLPLREEQVRSALGDPRLERAIGVIYRPETERQSHYFVADLAGQFDFVIHVDRTSALRPLDPGVTWHGARRRRPSQQECDVASDPRVTSGGSRY